LCMLSAERHLQRAREIYEHHLRYYADVHERWVTFCRVVT
jgi:hypothetical protein